MQNSSDVNAVAVDLVDAFTDVVDKFPGYPAIVYNGDMLDYGQLNAMVHATALRLGPRPGVVGVLTTRSPASIVALLGVLAAGGTYCPIDPTFPIRRQQAMLSAVDSRTVIATQPGQSAPPGVQLLEITDFPQFTGAQIAAIGSEGAAYILFTSGSTGDPKPVVTPRRAIAATVQSLHDLFALTPSDRVLQFASLNWDTYFEEILPTLTAGASLVFNDEAYSGSLTEIDGEDL